MEATIEHVRALAEAAGLSRIWWDTEGREYVVSDEALATVLTRLGLDAESEKGARTSLERLEEERRQPPRLVIGKAGHPTPLPPGILKADLISEDGSGRAFGIENGMLPAIAEPGYYTLAIGSTELKLAIAPRRCFGLDDLGKRKFWGPSIQISALRGKRAAPFGHLGHLDDAVKLFAARGADAVMISPMHALLPFTGFDYSPYSPSSKLFLNGTLGDPSLIGLPPLPERQGGDIVDWMTALPQRLTDLRALFDALTPAERAAIEKETAAGGEPLRRQAIFDALDVRFRAKGARGWQEWPVEFQDPENPAVARFANGEAETVGFFMFVQHLARQGLAVVKKTAEQSGMAIGLLADLAVGVRPSGADNWAGRKNMLEGLSIGAPPDPLGPLGQDWTLTTYSPRALRETGYAPFIDMLRATLDWAGGLRIDHAFGLSRLWVVPEGGVSRDGAYLRYPFDDLMALIALESHRARALIVAEDLGTKPPGFADAITDKNMLGMRVLWFERAMDKGFIGPQDYDEMSVAMTGTHDTPTVAGWWQGADLDLARQFGQLPDGTSREQAEEKRSWDRGLLWATFGGAEPRPAPEDPGPVVEAALHHVGKAKSRLAIAPLEDLFASPDQFNLPGIVGQYPSWRLRLDAPLAEMLEHPDNARRLKVLAEARKSSGEGEA